MSSIQNRGTNNTAYTPNADKTAQITGSGQPVPGTVTPTYVASGNTVIDAILNYSSFVNVVTVTGNSTIVSNNVANAGAQLVIQLSNDAGGGRTITFGTGFRSTGTVTGTASKAILVTFTSDGTTWNEDGRTSAALT